MSRCSVFLKCQNWCLCLCCSMSILHCFNDECISINSNIIVFVLLLLTYWNSNFSFLSRFSSFTLTIKKKYSDMLGIPICILITFYNTKSQMFIKNKNTALVLVFIHILVTWNVCFHKKFLKLLFWKIFDNFSEKFSRNVNTSVVPRRVHKMSGWSVPEQCL